MLDGEAGKFFLVKSIPIKIFFLSKSIFCSDKYNEACFDRDGLVDLMQAESEIEVQGLLDDLGLREKQQFVRVYTSSITIH